MAETSAELWRRAWDAQRRANECYQASAAIRSVVDQLGDLLQPVVAAMAADVWHGDAASQRYEELSLQSMLLGRYADHFGGIARSLDRQHDANEFTAWGLRQAAIVAELFE